ncbi:hypothetical protein AB4072_14570 [Microvirga sp. 2MCAF38]|uniref:hypothetical protein n=1 Tax=Microvirga sp. 2MCAF38 TaxID=3232989 RepID=UPI003F9DB9CC
MAGKAHDPRSEAEKARADLARNDAIGGAVPESPLERGPSVTPETFGDTSEKARKSEENQGVEAGGKAPARQGDDEDVLSRGQK